METKNPFTEVELGFPDDDQIFMGSFVRNLQFERVPVFEAQPWYRGVSELALAGLLVAFAAIFAYPDVLRFIQSSLSAATGSVISIKSAVNYTLIAGAMLVALPSLYAEFLRNPA